MADLDFNKLISKQGIPPWAQKYIRKQIGQYGDRSWKGAFRDVRALRQAPKLINQLRGDMNDQYARDIQAPTMQSVQGAFNQAAGRGVLNSSTSGDWMQRAAGQALMAGQQAHNASNIWAGNARIQNLGQRVGASQGLLGLTNSALGMTAKSTNPSALLPYLFNIPGPGDTQGPPGNFLQSLIPKIQGLAGQTPQYGSGGGAAQWAQPQYYI